MDDYIWLKQPELLEFTDADGQRRYGARQTWYEDDFQKKAGCGPTTAAHLACYLARANPGRARLPTAAPRRREDVLPLMREMWRYVRPRLLGVNDTGILAAGLERYAGEYGLPLQVRRLRIPLLPFLRPPAVRVGEFLAAALTADRPVAFLNLSNGRLANLDGWHWVTLVAARPAPLSAVMYDNGARQEIDLALWLETTRLGGGFVAAF
jgi:hypothetical protein